MTFNPSPGAIIDYKFKQDIECGVCLEIRGKDIVVLSRNEKEFKLPLQKIVHCSSYLLDTNRPKYELSQKLEEIAARRKEIQEKVSLYELWELIYEEKAGFSLYELADLYFSKGYGSDEEAALLKSLSQDKIYFRKKGEQYYPQPPEVTKQIAARIKKEKEAAKREEELVLWLEGVLEKETIHITPEIGKFLQQLKDYLIWEEKYEKSKQIRNILKRAKINDPEVPFEILIKAGMWEEDENALIYCYQIPIEFPSHVMEEAQMICEQFSLSADKRVIMEENIFTIDEETTTEIDDAISINDSGEYIEVGIHIADVTSFIPYHSAIDKEAHTRSTSIYLPEKKIEMIPSLISQDLASLKLNQERYALSVFVNFDAQGNIHNHQFKESFIRVDRRLTYKEADRLIATDKHLLKLYNIATALKEKRRRNGAIIFSWPRIEVKVTDTKEIIINKCIPDTPAQTVVSEFMILANTLAALYCMHNGVPAIYRSQPPPKGFIEADLTDPVSIFKQRKLIRKGEVSTMPSPHCALGVEGYVQITSPLRRYNDLIMHRQLKYFLNNKKAFYSEEELREIIAYSERWINLAEIVEKKRKRYWLLKYLLGRIGQRLPAVVLQRTSSEYIFQLSDYLLEITSPVSVGRELQEGDVIEVKLEEVKPNSGIIRVSY